MLEVESNSVIDRPVDTVFAFAADVDNLTLWIPNVIEARKMCEGTLRVGTRFRDVIQFLGRRFEADFEVTAYEPSRRLALQSSSGPFPIDVDQTFRPDGDRTAVTIVMRAEPGGFFKIAQPALVRLSQRQLDNSLSNLKDLVETDVRTHGAQAGQTDRWDGSAADRER